MVALALVFAACGGDDDNAGGSGDNAATATKQAGGNATATIKPEATAEPTDDSSGDRLADSCSLVTFAEISEIAGEEYGEGELNSANCTYSSPTNRTVNVTLADEPGLAEASFESFLADDNFGTPEEIDSVGERAAWVDSLGQLVVLVDSDRILIVNVPFIQAQDKKAAAIAIAQKALD